jgi:hypothetical protein
VGRAHLHSRIINTINLPSCLHALPVKSNMPEYDEDIPSFYVEVDYIIVVRHHVMSQLLVRTANARDTAISGLHGLRTTDYGLRTPGSSEVLGSPILFVYRGSRTRSVEHDQTRSIKSFSVALNTSFIVRNNTNNCSHPIVDS